MILQCIEGKQIKDIAADLGERPNTVITWRDQLIESGQDGLFDTKRSGKPVIYGDEFRENVLDTLKQTPPDGLERSIKKQNHSFGKNAKSAVRKLKILSQTYASKH